MMSKPQRPLHVMHELNDQKDVFCKIGSHLGDGDIDPNTPKSEHDSFINGDSGQVYSNTSLNDHSKAIKNTKNRSLQPNQQKKERCRVESNHLISTRHEC